MMFVGKTEADRRECPDDLRSGRRSGGPGATVDRRPSSSQAGRGRRRDQRWIKTLPGGATIEVIAVSAHPSGPNSWWGPDGSPLSQPPCDRPSMGIEPDRDVVFRAVLARVSGLAAGAPTNGWWPREAKGGSHGPATRNGKEVPGLSVVVAEFAKDLATCTVGFSVDVGPWQTVATMDGRGAGTGIAKDGRTGFMRSQAIATKRGAVLVVTHDILDVAVRLVAVDRAGKEHPAVGDGAVGRKGFYQLVAEFDLSPEEFQEYRLQTRPYERVEVRNVALKPVGAW